MAGISRPEISRLESGKRDYNGRNLRKIAAALQCTPADLIGRHPKDTSAEVFKIYNSIPPSERSDAELLVAELLAIVRLVPPAERASFLRRVKALTTGQNNAKK